MAQHRRHNRAVIAVRPEAPEARDEGPRFHPLTEEQHGESRLNHYIKLANIALGIPPGNITAKLPPKAK
jgi:hypothetical protein